MSNYLLLLIAVFVILTVVSFFGSLICVGLCLKIYTEIMKEHTIRKRYESQSKS